MKVEYSCDDPACRCQRPVPNEIYTLIECPQCGFEGAREISVKDEEIAHLTYGIRNAENVILSQREEIELLRNALFQIELCANNSMSSRGECGAIAWKALKGIP